MPDPIKILSWNINGLNSQDIDIAMISETHLTSRLRAEIHGYKLYVCNFPGDVSHGGAAIYVKSHIRHNDAASIRTDSIQSACISAKLHSGTSINLAAVYSPPRAAIDVASYSNLFRALGDKWIAGGDYNAKHPYWVLELLRLVAEHCFPLLPEMVWNIIQLVTLLTSLLIRPSSLIALISSYPRELILITYQYLSLIHI